MLRLVVSMSADAAKSYFSDALSKSDYYLSDQELPAKWHGRAAKLLGLEGEVRKEQFFALAENRHPVTGGAVTPGGNREYRRVGYDINFHCPKSVSILHGMGVDDQILPAFETSVEETMIDMEKDMQTRVRLCGEYADRTTGNMVWASFTHQTARPTPKAPPDPHLHSHCYTFNMTYDTYEERFKAGQFVQLKRDAMYYQALFHKRLADRLQGLGYSIKKTKDAFEVAEVNTDVIRQFSKRTNQIGQIAREKGITDAAELDGLGARTRSAKEKGLAMPDLRATWEKQLNGKNILRKAKGIIGRFSAQQCKDYALAHSFERNSVASDRAILRESLRHSMGSHKVSVEDLQSALDNDSRVFRVEHRGQVQCTTKEVLEEEREMVDIALKGRGRFSSLLTLPLRELKNPGLTTEQKQVINHLLLSRDSICLVQGRAGTGKTTMMTEVVNAIEETGKKVIAFAPTVEASRGVQQGKGVGKAATVASLLIDKGLQRAIKGQVLWIDEAGLIGSRDMVKVLRLVDKKDCRLILTGDDRQHRAVARGDAFRVLNEVAGLPTVGTRTIYRQKREEYRAAVADIAEGKTAQGFQKLKKMGAIKEMESDHIIDQLTRNYIDTVKKGKTALVISPTHKEREKVNVQIRSELQRSGKVKHLERVCSKLVPLNLTKAQKKDVNNFTPGMAIQTHLKISKSIPKGFKATVTKVEKSKVWIEGLDRKPQVLPLKNSDRFDVYERKVITIGQGELLRISKNGFDRNKSYLYNGQVMEVTGFSPDGHIRACTASVSGKGQSKEYTIDRFHENLDYAYCQTSYAAQGKTVDEVFIHQPAATFPATNQEQFYVSVSRGRDSVTIYTDDQVLLRQTAVQSSQRLAALELEVYPFMLEEMGKPMPKPEPKLSDPEPAPLPLKQHHGQGPSI